MTRPSHGGRRVGAGRPPVPEHLKRTNVTVKVLPKADEAWEKLARDADVSKGGILEWLTTAPEARPARRELVRLARKYIKPD